jgi:hypothetical protein
LDQVFELVEVEVAVLFEAEQVLIAWIRAESPPFRAMSSSISTISSLVSATVFSFFRGGGS